MFNVITRKAVLRYAAEYPAASTALFVWYYEMLSSEFTNFNELKRLHPSASLVGDNRVVFNIMGNRYRLVVRVIFKYRAVQVKWFGTHEEYNKIDVTTIQPER